jgi:hypothetical protein
MKTLSNTNFNDFHELDKNLKSLKKEWKSDIFTIIRHSPTSLEFSSSAIICEKYELIISNKLGSLLGEPS